MRAWWRLCWSAVLAGAAGCVVPTGGGGEEADLEPRLVELFSWWTAPGEGEALRALVAVHQDEHPEARMFNAAAASGEDARKALARRLDEGEPPDFFQGNAHDMRALFEAHPGRLQPLDAQFDALGLRSVVYPEVIQDLTIDGRLMSMPVNLHRENALFYNREIFARFELEAPETIDELVDHCEVLHHAGVVCIATSRQGWIQRIQFNTLAMGIMGGEEYVRVFEGELPVERSSLRAAIDRFAEITSRYTNADATEDGFGWTHAASAVRSGDAAMFLHGDWAKGYFEQLGWKPGEDFDVVGAPGATEVFLYGVDVFAIPTGAVNEAGARDFLTTVSSVDGQIAFNRIKGSSPIRGDIPDDRFDPVARATVRDLARAEVRLLVRNRPEWDAALERFTLDRDRDALYQVFLDYPPLPR